MTKLMKLVVFTQIVLFSACSFSDTENYIKRGDELILLEKYNEAISAYTKAIKLDSLNSIVFYKRALVLYEIEKYDLAIKDLDDAIKLNPEYDYYLLRGMVYQIMNQYVLSVTDLNYALSLDSTEDAFYYRAYSYVMLKDYTKALSDFKSTIQFSPKNAEHYFNVAALLIANGGYRAAIEITDVGLAYDKNNAIAYFNKGLAYKYLNIKDSAIYNLKYALKLGHEPASEFLKEFELKNDSIH
jgi:tetratricopeptide (TPR) repeat protein